MPPKRANSAAKAAAAQPLRRSTRRRSAPNRYTPLPPPPKVARKVATRGKAKAAKAVSKGKRKAEVELAQPQPKKSKANNGTAARGPGRPRKIATARKPSEKVAAAAVASKNRKIAKATKPSAKAASKPKAAPKPKKELPIVNVAPTQKLEIFAFGEGSSGELGLGAKNTRGRNIMDVKRPRLNPLLSVETVGVVAIAVGGMHCAAITFDNKILTWGVNDGGALGRDSSSEEVKLKDAHADGSDSDSEFDEDSGLNPNEASPGIVDPAHFPEGTTFASIYAGDSMTFVVTTTGLVYGWGSFRGVDGPIGFTPKVKMAETPMLIPELKGITSMACGTNHVLALDNKGTCWIWGAGEQNQLGRRVVARTAVGALVPRPLPMPRGKHVITHIASGDYHAFVVTTTGAVYAWGLNTYQQTGVPKRNIDDDIVNSPTLVNNLKDFEIAQLAGGSQHSIGMTKDGEVLVFGRVDSSEAGVDLASLDQSKLFFEKGKAKFVKEAIIVPNINATMVSTSNDTNMVIDTDGKAWSWGFSGNYQTGQGDEEEVDIATQIDNSAIRDKKLVFCGVGGQFAMLGGFSAAEEEDNVAPGLMNANAV